MCGGLGDRDRDEWREGEKMEGESVMHEKEEKKKCLERNGMKRGGKHA